MNQLTAFKRNSGKPIACLAKEALAHLSGLGYRPSTLSHYQSTWTALARFAEEIGASCFSLDLAEEFLVRCGVPAAGMRVAYSSQERHLRAAMRVLSEFALHGCFERRRRVSESTPLPERMAAALDKYILFAQDYLHTSKGMLRIRKAEITRLLYFATTRGVSDLSEVDPALLADYFMLRAHLDPKTLSVIACNLRSFLRYLVTQGVVNASIVEHVPRIRVRRAGRIPDVWCPESVQALLDAVERSSPVGKRDYAILLLAARLGMRAGDIRNLCLEDLRWEEARIEIKQGKTGEIVNLPLTEEVGSALIMYLREGRPPSTHRQVFLRANAPFEPFGDNDNLHHIISVYRRRAGIELPPQCRRGLHALRHTLATRLLAAGTPLEIISAIMGHVSPETTRLYTKVDIEALRAVALNPEEVRDA